MIASASPAAEASFALLAAQRQLLEKRKALGIVAQPSRYAVVAQAPANLLERGQHLLKQRQVAEAKRQGEMASAALKAASAPTAACPGPAETAVFPPHPIPDEIRPDDSLPTQTWVRLYPSIATAILRQKQAAAGRVWLLLRHLDQDGCGWLSIEAVRETLTGKESQLRVCGKRQLRNLLKLGLERFWTRDKERIWLYGAAKVAERLGAGRLRGAPVQLPLTHLLATIGELRAHLYASFHSGRRQERPVSREKLSEITGSSVRSLQYYDRRAGIKRHAQIAIGRRYSKAAHQEAAWQHRGTFILRDKQGQLGQPGQRYIAWQLPNCYSGCHQQAAAGRMRKINRQQADLVNSQAQGNGRRLFFESGKAAWKMAAKNEHVTYWQKSGADGLWFASA